ncbi:hypothetical protein CI238_03286, partial [Colletotrichum incanum]
LLEATITTITTPPRLTSPSRRSLAVSWTSSTAWPVVVARAKSRRTVLTRPLISSKKRFSAKVLRTTRAPPSKRRMNKFPTLSGISTRIPRARRFPSRTRTRSLAYKCLLAPLTTHRAGRPTNYPNSWPINLKMVARLIDSTDGGDDTKHLRDDSGMGLWALYLVAPTIMKMLTTPY